MNRDKLTGLFATALAIGLMASWSAYASSNQKGEVTVRTLVATAYVSPTHNSVEKAQRYPGVKVSVEPLSPKAKCTGIDQQELATGGQGKRVYTFPTSGKTGDDYGTAYFQHCTRGQYQISIETPAGMRMTDPNLQHQIVRLDPKRTTSVDFRMEKQK